MNDAQFTLVSAVRPIPNFEEVYQGQEGTIPIAFPGVLDPAAGKPGHAANLLAGISVPFGARLLIQIPMVIEQYTSVPDYAYQLVWRIRNQNDFNLSQTQGGSRRGSYHLPSQQFGRREVESIVTSDLYFIPGSSDIEIFENDNPGGSGVGTLEVRQQRYIPKMGDSWVQPLTESGAAGIWQQGAYQFSHDVNCSGPTWFPLFVDAGGDELMILVYKTNSDVAWDFTGADRGFSNTYGTNDGGLPLNPNIGILISSGTMGS